MLSTTNSNLAKLKAMKAARDAEKEQDSSVASRIPGKKETAEASPVKILAVFGTRPEAIKMAPVVLRLKQDKRFECKVCVSGQHRELLDGVLNDFSIVPDHDLNVMRDGQSFSEVAGKVLIGLDEYLDTYMPDLMLVHGDTATGTAAALCAFYRGIPVAHVEAGLRTGLKTSPFPEELNRQLISRIADLHFAPTQGAKANLIAEGIQDERIIVTGNTSIDAIRLMNIGLPKKAEKRYVIVTCHRKENIQNHLTEIISSVAEAAKEFPSVEFVYIIHPSPEVRQTVSLIPVPANFKIMEPVPYRQMLELMKGCCFMITDSGGIQEEAPALGKPVLLTRDATERPEAVAAGNVMIVGTDPANIIYSIRMLLTNEDVYKGMSQFGSPFGDGHAADAIASVLAECFSLA